MKTWIKAAIIGGLLAAGYAVIPSKKTEGEPAAPGEPSEQIPAAQAADDEKRKLMRELARKGGKKSAETRRKKKEAKTEQPKEEAPVVVQT